MNSTHVEGSFDVAKGKVKQAIGETFNDQSLANEGAVDEVKGHAKEAWGNVKDAASDIGNQHEAEATATEEKTGHNIRTSITDAVDHAKDSISRTVDHLKHDR